MQRLKLLKTWLNDGLSIKDYAMTPASSDASFRRYFRLSPNRAGARLLNGYKTLIVMDAPPEQEDIGPFIKVSKLFADIQLNVPLIQAMDADNGFLLLTDLGSEQYLSVLTEQNVDQMYGDALAALLNLQQNAPRDAGSLPPYDNALLMREMELFRQWYLQGHLGLTLNNEQNTLLQDAFELLAAAALDQPVVCVHRDYHSRNLMVTEHNNPGVLDFQDAVIGPITYDLASLLRDCYIAWPRQRVERWALDYMARAQAAGLLGDFADAVILRWFDWMGMQRHLKAIGIFSRLDQRDGKPGYLKDIPRTVGYVLEVSNRYVELERFGQFLTTVIPSTGVEQLVQ